MLEIFVTLYLKGEKLHRRYKSEFLPMIGDLIDFPGLDEMFTVISRAWMIRESGAYDVLAVKILSVVAIDGETTQLITLQHEPLKK